MDVLRGIWRWMGRGLVVVIALVVVAGAVVVFAPERAKALLEKTGGATALLANILPPPLPATTEIKEAHWLDQSWSNRDRYWFHHASQGTATLPVPYDWFVELERPELSPFSAPGRLADSAYLQRFGFIPSPASSKASLFDGKNAAAFGYQGKGLPDVADAAERYRITAYPENPDGLPVGFARLEEGIDPTTQAKFPAQIGFTCAACHTGHLEYNKVSLRFDGGPAMLDLGKLEPAIGLSILYTLHVPGRLDRFADRLAKRNPGWAGWKDRSILERELQEVLNKILVTQRWAGQSSRTTPVEEGFGRLDALNRIGNQVFFENLLPAAIVTKDPRHPDTQLVPNDIATNFAPVNAPVSFPPIWDVPIFSWAQYDASIFNELVRNAGEALGVGAKINMTGKDPARYFSSSVQIATIVEVEKMLRGSDPLAQDRRSFDGLAAPRWSDAAKIFANDKAWQLDAAKVESGRQVYRALCVECHRGPVRDAEFDRLWPEYSFWSEKSPDREDPNWFKIGGRNFFNVVQRPVADMGTDRQQARVLVERKVALPRALRLDAVKILNERSNCGLADGSEFSTAFAPALMAVVERTIEKWFADNPTAAEVEKEMRGPRPNCPNTQIFTTAGMFVPHYRARPLDGVWATAPYLHNGSVPTLHAMLVPQHERPRTFCVGTRQFDPRDVGLKMESTPCATGLTTFDATELGNSNLGHSFEGTETEVRRRPRGVIGPALTPDQRDSLVEYLKTL